MHEWPKVCWKSSSAASVQLQMLSAARIMKISIFKRRIGLFIFSRKYSSFLHKYSYLLNIYRINLLSSFLKKGRRYHVQLHWSSWRTIPAHLGSWMHGTLCQYFCYVCLYVYCPFCFEKKDFLLAPDTICSCIEAVDELFQDTSGYDCIENDVNTIAVCVCMTIVYCILKKRRFSWF